MNKKKLKKTAEFTTFCRLCLAIGRELVLINSETKDDDIDLLETVLDLLDIRLRRTSQSQLCSPCISFLRCFKTFKEMTKRAQEICAKYFLKEEMEIFPTLEVPNRINGLKEIVDEAEDILRQSSTINAEYYKTVYDLNDDGDEETDVTIKHEPEVKIEEEEDEETLDEPQIEDEDSKEEEELKEEPEKPKKGKYRVHKCDVCQKLFDGYDIKYHKNVHLKIYPFKCEICHKKFASPARLSSHKKVEHKPEVEPPMQSMTGEMHPCEACGRLFTRKKLWDHQKKFHSEIYKCDFDECEESFPNFYKLNRHQKKQHFNPAHQKYTCELCGKAFRKTRLKYHMNIHLNIKPFVCDFDGCGKACPDPGQLAVHKRIIHLKTIKITCKVCGKPFKTKADHDIHFTYHGEPSLPCQVCGRLLMNRKTLAKHMLTHTGEKKYICKFEGCAKNFTNSTGLTVHIRSHTKEKPYACSDCSEKFTYRIGLRRHSEKVHGKVI